MMTGGAPHDLGNLHSQHMSLLKLRIMRWGAPIGRIDCELKVTVGNLHHRLTL
jgi:hypothetical protein